MIDPVRVAYLKGALIAAFHYHPFASDVLKTLIPTVRREHKLPSVFSTAGDVFANIWSNLLMLPPDDYPEYAALFFEDTQGKLVSGKRRPS